MKFCQIWAQRLFVVMIAKNKNPRQAWGRGFEKINFLYFIMDTQTRQVFYFFWLIFV